jgi:hypothetical protein
MKPPIDCNVYRRPRGVFGPERWRFLIRYPNGDERDVFSDSPRIVLGEGQTLLARERTFPGAAGSRFEVDPVQAARRREQRDRLQRLLSVALKQIEHDYRSCVEYAVAASVERWNCYPGRLQLRTYSKRRATDPATTAPPTPRRTTYPTRHNL